MPDISVERTHDAAARAWGDYAGRIDELEGRGYSRSGEEAAAYGRRWEHVLLRGAERVVVTIERAG